MSQSPDPSEPAPSSYPDYTQPVGWPDRDPYAHPSWGYPAPYPVQHSRRSSRPGVPGWTWPVVALVALLVGLVGGVAGGLLTTVLVALAGGSVGPGRMSDVGAPLLDTLVSSTVAMGVGGLLGGIVVVWWARRR